MKYHKQIAGWLGLAGLSVMLGVTASQAALISQYELEGNALDAFGVSNGSIGGSPTTVAGKIDNAFQFNGASYVSIADVAAQRPTDITVSAWVKTTDAGAFRGVFDKVQNSRGIALFVNSGNINLTTGKLGFGGNSVTGGSVVDGNWHLVMGSFQTTNVNNSGIMRLYVDGLLAGSAGGFYVGEPTAAYIAGDGASTFNLTGAIDDVGLWSEVLTDAKARAVYSLADNGTLNYDLGQAQQLFDVFDAASGSTVVEGLTWKYWPISSGTPGVVQQVGTDFYLPLGGGFGVAAIPEPTTAMLLGVTVLGLLRLRRAGRE